jgi:Homeodomain-like domain
MKTYSEDLKWRIIHLWSLGHSNASIKQLLDISRPTIKRVKGIYMLYGTVTDPFAETAGRKKLFERRELDVSIFESKVA